MTDFSLWLLWWMEDNCKCGLSQSECSGAPSLFMHILLKIWYFLNWGNAFSYQNYISINGLKYFEKSQRDASFEQFALYILILPLYLTHCSHIQGYKIGWLSISFIKLLENICDEKEALRNLPYIFWFYLFIKRCSFIEGIY